MELCKPLGRLEMILYIENVYQNTFYKLFLDAIDYLEGLVKHE